MKKSALSRFDTRSLAFFAGLALTGSLATAQAVFGPSAPAKPPAAVAAPVTPTGTAPAKDAFRQADADGNGSVSRAEALRAGTLARSFDKLDANKDGALSRVEFEVSLKK